MIQSPALAFFAAYIEREIGIVYSEVNSYQLQNRVEKITKLMGHETIEQLFEAAKVSISGNLKMLLLDAATNNETLFFRDVDVFDSLRQVVFPSFKDLKQTVRMWSAACSTGQEVYSVKILLEEMEQAGTKIPVELLATDISERVLARASSGRFTQLEVQRGLSTMQLLNNFRQVPEDANCTTWEIKPELKRNLSFRYLNLLDNWNDLGTFDVILCRNVLIYQSVESKQKVVEKLTRHLRDGGYLILGGAESLLGISEHFTSMRHKSAILYKKKPLIKSAIAS